ncbi:hypothetical protein [Rhizobium mesoamericanum]|uniref:Uncharacterized protein n=1 Tax=Rhizobium mesoamericanum STM3625 TaxID=1211777 RepID=K0Q144_9HYPH|nr:hypothetical protein [Rhizobium mesoamericanum]CCM80083.1 hypothetical protein BN77_p2170005 [Rhizobium mesoamericanum STM3625]
MTNDANAVELSQNIHVIESQFDKAAYALIVQLSNDLKAVRRMGLTDMNHYHLASARPFLVLSGRLPSERIVAAG